MSGKRSSFAKTCYLLSFILAIFILLIFLLLNHMFGAYLRNKSIQTVKLNINNMDVWANFPDRLDMNVQYQASFFNLDEIIVGENKSTIKVSEIEGTHSLKQEISRIDPIFSAKTDEVTVRSNSTFYDLNSATNKSSISYKHLNLGLLESLSTLSNIPTYRLWLTASYYGVYKTVQENLMAKFFTVFAYDYIINNKNLVFATILKDIPERDTIYNDAVYGWQSVRGFYKWAILIIDNGNIKKAKWLEELKISSDTVTKLVKEDSYFQNLLRRFNDEFSLLYKCEVRCKEEDLMAIQQITGNLTQNIPMVTRSFNNIKEISEYVDIYNYDESPEMIFFYQKYFSKNHKNVTYDDVKFFPEQVFGFFDTNLRDTNKAKTNLFLTANMLDFYFSYTSKDIYSSYLKFNIKSMDQMNFLAEYLQYLADNFYKIRVNGFDFKVSDKELAFASLSPQVISSSIQTLSDNESVRILSVSKLTYDKKQQWKETCTGYLTEVLSDQTRANKICSTQGLGMDSYNSIKTWLLPIILNTKEAWDLIVKQTGMSLVELEVLYSSKYLGKAIGEAESIMKNEFECGASKCTNEYLALLQWKFSTVSKFLDQNNNSLTLHKLDRELFKIPAEFNYFCGGADNCKDGTDLLLNLYGNKEDYISKTRLSIIISLINNEKYEAEQIKTAGIRNPKNYFLTLKQLYANYLFDDLVKEYDSSKFIFGTEDVGLLPLKTGLYFEGYKPKLSKTTGLSLQLSNEIRPTKTNTYTYLTGLADDKQIKQITMLNNLNMLNTYTNILNGEIYEEKNIPLFENATFFEISDGTQYSYKRRHIYYFDEISGRVFKYNYKNTKKHGHVECWNFHLDDDISQGLSEIASAKNSTEKINKDYGSVFSKFNMPFVVSRPNLFSKKVQEGFQPVTDSKTNQTLQLTYSDDDNYICVDKYTNMVLESKQTLLYSIYTNGLSLIDNRLPDKTLIPYFKLVRETNMDMSKFDEVFTQISTYSKVSSILFVVGIILSILFMICAVAFCIRYRKLIKTEKVEEHENILSNAKNDEIEKAYQSISSGDDSGIVNPRVN